MTDYIYMEQCGTLVLWSLEVGASIWVGYPMGRRVQCVQAIKDTYDAVVLLERTGSEGARTSNLIRWRMTDSVVWAAEAPDELQDDFGNPIHVSKEKVTAYHMSGFSVTLDTNTGKIVEYQFIK